MSLSLKTIYNTLVGAWGGFIAWLILDLLLRFNTTNVWLDAVVNGAMVGMFIGAFVSAFGGVMEWRAMLVVRGLAIGLITGIIGGVVGLLVGQVAYEIGRALDLGDLVRESFRALGWAIFGIGIGAAEGVRVLSPRRLIFGGLGGVLGGFAGGIAFMVIARLSNLQLTNRAVGFVLLGAFIGLLSATISSLGVAIVKVISSGRNEGKEFLIDKPLNVIGSQDNCDVGLYGDPTVAPKHAEIRQEGGQFVLQARAGQTVFVNDAPTPRSVLQDRMQFRVGNVRLVFRRKGG